MSLMDAIQGCFYCKKSPCECREQKPAPLTMTAEREAEIRSVVRFGKGLGPSFDVPNELLAELDAERAAHAETRRFVVPWTLEILNQKDAHWIEFCYDAPLTLADAEKRERALKAENPAAEFRVVPWTNPSQRQAIQRERDELRSQLVAYHAMLRCTKGHIHNGKYGEGCPFCQLAETREIAGELAEALDKGPEQIEWIEEVLRGSNGVIKRGNTHVHSVSECPRFCASFCHANQRRLHCRSNIIRRRITNTSVHTLLTILL